jgi:hypothetical protein
MAFPITMNKTMIALALACAPACVLGTGEDEDGESGSGSASDDGPTSTNDGPSTGEPTTDPSASSDPTVSSLDGSTTDVPACEQPPIEQEVLDSLFIDAGMSSSVAAGADTQLRLVWIDFGTPTAVEACVEWSIEPVEGVAIDATGLLSVDASVATGTTISVTADVEAGRRVLTADFEVYVPLEYDILGYWTETMQLPCDGGAPFEPDPVIGEMVFQNTGEFSVTWTPFEVYYDYWGTYTYDEGTGALVLTVDGGNYVPEDIDGEGTATVVDGVLTLEDMWLGVAQEPVTPVACGHTFD